MKLELFGAILVGLLGGAVQAADPAPRVPVLAELFTSEGCSSCPPADSLLMKLDRTQPVAGAQIIVLSEHVDYWNHLGWSDPFSSPQFSSRQEMYGRIFRSDIYTPQLVIDGRKQIVGSDARAIQASISREISRPRIPLGIINAQRQGSEAVVTLSAGTGRGDVWLAVADDSDESSVRKGENSGKHLAHVAVVRHLEKVGTLSASKAFEKQVQVPLTARATPAGTRIVAFIADPAGPVQGADMVLLKP